MKTMLQVGLVILMVIIMLTEASRNAIGINLCGTELTFIDNTAVYSMGRA